MLLSVRLCSLPRAFKAVGILDVVVQVGLLMLSETTRLLLQETPGQLHHVGWYDDEDVCVVLV